MTTPSRTPTRADRVRARSQARREHERASMRATILDIALRQLVAHGYERFSLREVAEEAGYTPTALYRYFADRDALLQAVLEGCLARFAAALAAADATGRTARERLQAQAEGYVRFAIDNPEVYRAMFLERPELGMSHTMDQVASDPAFATLMRAVQALAAEEGIGGRSAEEVSLILWAGVHGLATMAVTMDLMPPEALLALARQVSATIQAGVLGR
ncbi:MAG: TetR/AcrR family transcriptional regulator [Gemmatimonadetes bacterium]|nr:TetR/AcrR family transcriptional regulator [Gemmatimonadota bacterium]